MVRQFLPNQQRHEIPLTIFTDKRLEGVETSGFSLTNDRDFPEFTVGDFPFTVINIFDRGMFLICYIKMYRIALNFLRLKIFAVFAGYA